MSPKEALRKWNDGTISALDFLKAIKCDLHWLNRGLSDLPFTRSPMNHVLKKVKEAQGRETFHSVDDFLIWLSRQLPDLEQPAYGREHSIAFPQQDRWDLCEAGDFFWDDWEDESGERREGGDRFFTGNVHLISFNHPAFRPLDGSVDVENHPLAIERLRFLVSSLEEVDPQLSRLLILRDFGGLGVQQLVERTNRTAKEIGQELLRAEKLISERYFNQARLLVPQIFDFQLADLDLLRSVSENPDLLRAVSWRTFEKILARTLEEYGFMVELRRGTKDGGIDVIGIRKDPSFGNHRYLIQAKKWKGRVGVEPVRELLFLHDQIGATKSCLATTSDFTSGALRYAADYWWKLELKAREDLVAWIRGAMT